MPTKDELIFENELLRKKLALAEAWMRREVAYQKKSLSEKGAKMASRKSLDNVLERESIEIISRQIEVYFGSTLDNAPKFTKNHLIDAEIYWQTLQKFPTLDALPVVSSYQKILESYFENITIGFRDFFKKRQRHKKNQPSGVQRVVSLTGIDRDIENVVRKNYSLSLGRWFHFFEKIRFGNDFGGFYEDTFLEYMTEYYEELVEMCISDPFYSSFQEIIALEVFSKKRHEVKVSYQDASTVRSICIGGDGNHSILRMLFLFGGRVTKSI